MEDLRKGEAYLIFSDTDLIRFLKYVSLKGWKPDRDVGLISYDDTPLKEILADGVTVITTDFESMGRTAAEMIINKADYKKINPSMLIKRKTL